MACDENLQFDRCGGARGGSRVSLTAQRIIHRGAGVFERGRGPASFG